MGATNKKKKGQGEQQQGPYKKFLNDLQEVFSIIFTDMKMSELSNDYRRMMFDFKYIFQSPKAFNEFVSSAELKIIGEKARTFFHTRDMDHKDMNLSAYQLHLLWCYLQVKVYKKEKEIGSRDAEVSELFEQAEKICNVFYCKYLVDYFKIVTQLSSPDHKYLGIAVRSAALFKENLKMEIVIEVYGFQARKSMMEVNGHKRPAYRLGKPLGTKPIEWISMDVSLLGKHYKGNKKELQVYIQSHALKRFKERLDILDQGGINYLLWTNTSTITHIEIYRGFLLLPIKVFDVKIGYLVGNIVEDKFLFSTFLFITHSCCPEGDLLKKITGLGKQDISYWHIDRLSTFMDLQADKHPELIQLFNEAGLGDLKELRNKKFDIDTLQDANLDAFTTYISRNKSIPA